MICDRVDGAAALATESYQSSFCLPSQRPAVGDELTLTVRYVCLTANEMDFSRLGRCKRQPESIREYKVDSKRCFLCLRREKKNFNVTEAMFVCVYNT